MLALVLLLCQALGLTTTNDTTLLTTTTRRLAATSTPTSLYFTRHTDPGCANPFYATKNVKYLNAQSQTVPIVLNRCLNSADKNFKVTCRLGLNKYTLFETRFAPGDTSCTTPLLQPGTGSIMISTDHQYLCQKDAELGTYTKIHCGEDDNAALSYPTLVSPVLYPNSHCGGGSGGGSGGGNALPPPTPTKRQQFYLNRCLPVYGGGHAIDTYAIVSQKTWSPNGGLELTVQTFAKPDFNCSKPSSNRRSITYPPVPSSSVAGVAPACLRDPFFSKFYYLNAPGLAPFLKLPPPSAAPTIAPTPSPTFISPTPVPTASPTYQTFTYRFSTTSSKGNVTESVVNGYKLISFQVADSDASATSTTTSAQFTFTPTSYSLSAQLLLVGGGGGGGVWGGGGGAGQVQFATVSLTAGQTYSITVGNGGLSMKLPPNPAVYKGGDSSITGPGISMTSYDGAGGAGIDWSGLASITAWDSNPMNAYSTAPYGSGGGGWFRGDLPHCLPSGPGCTASATSFCSAGGDGISGYSFYNEPSGGGGGAGGVGKTATVPTSGDGGPGLLWPYSGLYYAGGGGGGGSCNGRVVASTPNPPGFGGRGGGGAGGSCSIGSAGVADPLSNGVVGAIHTGSGGGGGSYGKNACVNKNPCYAGAGGKGGSGIAILAVPVLSLLQNPIAAASTIDILVVAGGGGGGTSANGGRGSPGGAGGLIYITGFPVGGSPYTITVGAGGPLCANTGGTGCQPGYDSVFSGNGRTLTALGGGSGKNMDGQGIGQAGGSGAGPWYPGYAGGLATQSSSTNDGITVWPNSGFGNPGGISGNAQPYGGGGGGAGGPGGNWNDATLGPVGGIGKAFDISGVSTYYAGGGGNACYTGTCRYAGGLGGGGKGDNLGTATDSAGVPNTGGGGGSGGAGGSGVIIIRYPSSSPPLSVTPGLAFSLKNSGGNWIYSFTAGSGSVAFPSQQTPTPAPTALPSSLPTFAPTPLPTTPFPTNIYGWGYYDVPIYGAYYPSATAWNWNSGDIYFTSQKYSGVSTQGGIFKYSGGVVSAFLLGGVCGFDINQNTGEVYVGYTGATGAGPVQIVKVTVDGVMTVIATAGASDDWCGNIKLDKNVPPNIYMASWREGGTPRWGTPKVMSPTGVVTLLSPGGGYSGEWGRPMVILPDGKGNTYVSEFRSDRVTKIASNGALSVLPFSCTSTSYCSGLDIDRWGNIYATFDTGGTIAMTNPATGVCRVIYSRNCGNSACASNINVDWEGTSILTSDFINRGGAPDHIWRMVLEAPQPSPTPTLAP